MSAAIFDFNGAGAQPDARQKSAPAVSASRTLEDFRAWLLSIGLKPEAIAPTGDRIARCPTADDKPGRTSGWYVFYADGLPAGEAGSWKSGESYTWCAKEKDSMTPSELKIAQAHWERSRIAREQARAELAVEAAARAEQNWAKAIACEAHPYLSNKGIASFGLRVLAGKLLVPVTSVDGALRSIQEIDAAGEKKFYFGGRVEGGFYYIPGNTVTAVAEGYATAASIHMATGWSVLVVFNAGNLQPVAESWRAAHPHDRMVICGDDDKWIPETPPHPGNVGRKKATACAAALGVKAVFPIFKNLEGQPTDFNDLHQREGLPALRAQLLAEQPVKRDIRQWGLEQFAGDAPERRWVVENIMPSGAVFILAAMGDAGKGMLTLDLGLKVAGKAAMPQAAAGGMDFNAITAFGNRILRQGPVVILSAEDDKSEVHRRLQNIGAGGARDMYVVPLSNAGGPLPIIIPGKHGPELSPEWLEVRDQIVAMKPALVVIDPLASFVMADINTDPAVGAYTMGHMSQFAQEADAAVVLVHHLAKTKTNISTPEEARALIRGTSAIVDNARAAYVLWGVEEKSGKATCAALELEWRRNRVMRGCLVKSNGPGDREVKTWVRNDIGLLEVRNEQLKIATRQRVPALMDSLLACVAEAASKGQPFTKTGSNGLYARRQELPPELCELGRNRLEGFAQDLLEKGTLVLCIAKGSTTKKWLDVPDGDFALGVGDFAMGSAVPDGSQKSIPTAV